MKDVIIAGDSLDFLRAVDNYPASDGFTLVYRLVPRSGGAEITVNCSTASDGVSYHVQVMPATTAGWPPGEYGWSSWVEKTGARITVVAQDSCTILPDPATVVGGTDLRSQAQKAVDDLKAAYATFVGSQGHVQEYEIAGRRMKFATAGDIVLRMQFWQGELTRENAAKAVALGLYDPRRIYLRQGRA